MARRKNVKRIDPRYFLNETVNRDINTGEALEEERQAPVTHWVAGPDGLTDQHGDVFVKHGTAFAATRSPTQKGMMVIGVGHGTGTERWFGERPVPYEDVQKHRSNPNYNPPQPGPDSRTSRNSPVVQEETVDRGEEELEEGWKDFTQGASDFLDETLMGKPRGHAKKSRETGQRRAADKEATSARIAGYDARAQEKALSTKARRQAQAQSAKERTQRDSDNEKWDQSQKVQQRRAQKKKDDDRRHSGFGSDHYVEQE